MKDEHETVTFAEFRRRARVQARVLRDHDVSLGDRVIVVMPQGVPAMTVFVGAMMLGAVATFLASPNFKIEPAKYSSGLAGVTANLSAKVVVMDDHFPHEMLSYVSLTDKTMLLRASDSRMTVENWNCPSRSINRRGSRSFSTRLAQLDCRRVSPLIMAPCSGRSNI